MNDIDVGFNFNGRKGDIDIVTSNYFIEVKSGSSGTKLKLEKQSAKNKSYAESLGIGYILYVPNATKIQIYEATKQGYNIITSEKVLMQTINN